MIFNCQMHILQPSGINMDNCLLIGVEMGVCGARLEIGL